MNEDDYLRLPGPHERAIRITTRGTRRHCVIINPEPDARGRIHVADLGSGGQDWDVPAKTIVRRASA